MMDETDALCVVVYTKGNATSVISIKYVGQEDTDRCCLWSLSGPPWLVPLAQTVALLYRVGVCGPMWENGGYRGTVGGESHVWVELNGAENLYQS